MKKLISILTAILIICSMIPIESLKVSAVTIPTTSWKDYADTSWYNEWSDKFILSNASQLAGLAELVNQDNTFKDKIIELSNDIDIGEHLWNHIGKNPNKIFSGTFDGKGYCIKNITINNQTNGEYEGFFSYVKDATVKRLGIVGGSINNVGVQVGAIASTAENSTIENCYNTCDVTGTNIVAGIVGFSTESTIRFCYNAGNITLLGDNSKTVGGICGVLYGRFKESTIDSCYNVGTIKAEGENTGKLGGILGVPNTASNNEQIKNCYNIGNIIFNGKECCGAISGKLLPMSNCYYSNYGGAIGQYGSTTAIDTTYYNVIAAYKFANLINSSIAYKETTTVNEGANSLCAVDKLGDNFSAVGEYSSSDDSKASVSGKNVTGEGVGSTTINGTISIKQPKLDMANGGWSLTDFEKYSTTVAMPIDITKVDPDYTIPTGLTGTYANSLRSVSLPEGWSWVNENTLFTTVETKTFEAVYTPTDTQNYKTVTKELEVDIKKAVPIYTVPTGLTATYGDTLSSVILPSGWQWNDTTTVGNVGTNTFSATFTPDDTEHYSTVTKNVEINVVKAVPIYTVPSGITIEYGKKLSLITLPTGWSFVDSNQYVGDVGTKTFRAIYTPDDTHNLNTVTTDIEVVVKKAEPLYTLPSSLTATYGDRLSSVVLPDGWSFVDSSQYVGDAGTRTFRAIFTPNDTQNFNTVTTNLSVVVKKAEPLYTLPGSLTATYGDLLSSVVLPNGWSWVENLQTVGNYGTNSFNIVFTPNDTLNYNKVTKSVSVLVSKANPSFSVPTDIQAVYGQKLSDIALPMGFIWDDPSQFVESIGNKTFSATYYPTDSTNFNRIVGINISVSVSKARPDFTVPNNIQALSGTKLKDVLLPIGFSFKDGNIKLEGMGVQEVSAIFTPSDYVNYDWSKIDGWSETTKTVEIKIPIKVGKKATAVEIKKDTPNTVVENIDKMFNTELIAGNTDNNNGVTVSDIDKVENGGSIELRVIVEKIKEDSVSKDIEKIKALNNKIKIGVVLDAKVIKKVTDANSSVSVFNITKLPSTIRLTVEIPEELRNKQNLTVYRVHDGIVEALKTVVSADGKNATFETDRFSTYVLGYNENINATPQTTPNPKTDNAIPGSIMLLAGLSLAIVVFIGKRKK